MININMKIDNKNIILRDILCLKQYCKQHKNCLTINEMDMCIIPIKEKVYFIM